MNSSSFLVLLSVAYLLTACHSGVKQSSEQRDAAFYPNLVHVHLTGKVDLPDSTRIYINTQENTMQPLLATRVLNGSFTLEGELEEPDFYNLVIQKEKFSVYLENAKDYHFEANVSGGKVQSGNFKTNSATQQHYQAMERTRQQEMKALGDKAAKLRTLFDNPKTYQAAVDQYERLSKQRASYPEQLQQKYLDDPAVAPAIKIYLIKNASIGADNHDAYHRLLLGIPDSLKSISLYRQALAKVEQVHDFFTNMPDFPDIQPRNLAGDSLKLADFRAAGRLLFVFWGSWNKEARADIQQIKSKAAALAKLGVQPIFLTWEKDFAAWEKASADLSLGKHNYRLNAHDQDFMVKHYAVRKLPHYMLVNAKDLQILNYHFTYPLDGQLERDLRKE